MQRWPCRAAPLLLVLDVSPRRTTVSGMGSEATPQAHERVTILPLRNAVLFPMSVVPINVGRPRSVRVVEDLMGQDRALVGVATQRSPDIIEPTFEDLYEIGTL